MRIPQSPPNEHAILQELMKHDSDRALALLTQNAMVDGKGRYFHWDQMRFREPPEPFTVKEWWVKTRLARSNAAQTLPLTDKGNRPFTFCEPNLLKLDLHKLDLNAGGALGSAKQVLSSQDASHYLTKSLAEEPFASSFIEGAATTRQIAKKLIFENRAPRNRDELMVLNNYNALEFVKEHKSNPLTMPLLLALHKIVTDGTLDNNDHSGRFRDSDDIQVVDETSGEVLHQPPLASELTSRMRAVLAFANRETEDDEWIHPLVRAFCLHFMLSYEHPFVDGNGRVARALFYWAALRNGYWLTEYVSISSIIAESKVSYGRSFLYVESDKSDLTYFLIYHAKILVRAMERLHDYVEKKRYEVATIDRRIADRSRPDSFNHRQSSLIGDFVRGFISKITLAEYERQYRVSYMTARNDLESLLTTGFVIKDKEGRQSVYRASPGLSKLLLS